MRKTIITVASALAILAVVIGFAANNFSSVSAKQILGRAAAAQTSAQAGQGIWYSLIEEYDNPQALAGQDAGTKTVIESFEDRSNGLFRSTTRDASGAILDAGSYDGAYTYAIYPSTESGSDQPLLIHRRPDDPAKAETRIIVSSSETADATTAIFEQFKSNQNVEVRGKQTMPDGSEGYVLVARNMQLSKLADGQTEQTQTGSVKMVFDVKTYAVLEIEQTIRKDGKDLVLNSVRWLKNETLPADTPVAWDLSDVQGATIIDEQNDESFAEAVTPRSITPEELATHEQTYLLKTVPEGYTLEIIESPDQQPNEPYRYEATYSNTATQDVFHIMAVGFMDPAFVEKSFYDGSYKAASGMVLHFSPSSTDMGEDGKPHTNGMLIAQDQVGFLVDATLPREQLQALIEGMAPAQ